jgi:hypothetical protein
VSTDPIDTTSVPYTGEAPDQPSEEELRAAYEAEISRVTSTDMILQAVVSLLNIGGHRLGFTSEGGATADESSRDLEQVRDAIDGVRALMPVLERREPENLRPLRDALSQLQMAYAREAGASAPTAGRPGESTPPGAPGAPAPAPAAKPTAPAPQGEPADGPGPAQSSGRLWVPGR